MASDGTKTTIESSSARKSKEKEKNIGWDYAIPENRDHVKCSFCYTIYKGGITRLKYHLIGNNKNVATCKRCPIHVKERLEDITRLKYHLIGNNKNVAACKRCPIHVKERHEENWKQKLEEK
ncbi:hypothetical protein LIER_32509 [Lithospermum erythrorhizon]|uniref:BED-type domain-containing protein n=1 Tax=Lithospermum erythrorhizon TaxID=34254 RepID=A0AAV3RZD8_LITER